MRRYPILAVVAHAKGVPYFVSIPTTHWRDSEIPPSTGQRTVCKKWP